MKTLYTTTYNPFLPSYVSQYPETRVSSACSCVPPFEVITITASLPAITVTSKNKASTDTTSKYSATTVTTEFKVQYRPATATYPALCYPTNLALNYAIATPSRAVKTISAGQNLDDLHCCTACYNKKDCLYWSNAVSGSGTSSCKVVVGTDKVKDSGLGICPLGIGNKGGLGGLGDGTLNLGPCLSAGEVLLMSTPCGGTGGGCP